MSGKKEHKKGGKQYWHEKKRKASEEGSVGSTKPRRSEGEWQKEEELEETDVRPTPVIEEDNDEDDSDELPDVKL